MINNYIDTFDITQNFWKLHPEFKVLNPFKDLYTNDKSKGKDNSSMMMWFVALCYSKQSKFRNLSKEGEDGKHQVIGEDYCGDKLYYDKHQPLIDTIIDAFIEVQYTPLERQLITWDELLDNRTHFIKTQKYDLSTYEDLDKMAAATAKVFAAIKDIWEELEKEDNTGVGKGGAMSSLND